MNFFITRDPSLTYAKGDKIRGGGNNKKSEIVYISHIPFYIQVIGLGKVGGRRREKKLNKKKKKGERKEKREEVGSYFFVSSNSISYDREEKKKKREKVIRREKKGGREGSTGAEVEFSILGQERKKKERDSCEKRPQFQNLTLPPLPEGKKGGWAFPKRKEGGSKSNFSYPRGREGGEERKKGEGTHNPLSPSGKGRGEKEIIKKIKERMIHQFINSLLRESSAEGEKRKGTRRRE